MRKILLLAVALLALAASVTAQAAPQADQSEPAGVPVTSDVAQRALDRFRAQNPLRQVVGVRYTATGPIPLFKTGGLFSLKSFDPGGGGNSYCWPSIFGAWAYFNDPNAGMTGWFLCSYASSNGQRFVNNSGYGWVRVAFGQYLPYGTPAWFLNGNKN